MDPILFPLHNENRSVPQTIRPQDNKELPTQLQRVGNISLRNGHIFSELKEENDESYQNVLEQVSNEQALPDSALLVRSVVNLFHKSDEVDSPQDILHSKVNSNIQLFSCDNQVVYSCKHKFPFRTVKSHPKVYYTDRRYKMKTKRPVVDNSDTTAQRINGDKHCLLNKYELLRLITRTDIAIAETERKIEHLRQQLKHFPLSADRRNGFSSIKNLSYKIYEENRRKAETSYSTVLKVSPNSISISGIQPYETKVLKENAEKYEVFRPLLMEYLSKKRQAQSAVTNMTAHLYLTWKTAWLTELNMLEESEAWKKRESSKLEYFEKVFPELRIERENWEILRSATVRTRNRTLRKDYMCFLKEKQLIDEKRSRLCAAQIPDLLDREARDQVSLHSPITTIQTAYTFSKMKYFTGFS